MKDYDDELKDLFQNKNLENAFSPDEQNWMKMATVLKNEQKVKRKILLYLTSFVLLTGVVGTAYFLGAGTSADTLALTSQQTIKKDEALNLSTELPELAARIKKESHELTEGTKLKQEKGIEENAKISDKMQLPAQIAYSKVSDNKKLNKEKNITERNQPVQKRNYESLAVGSEKSNVLQVSPGQDGMDEAALTKSIPVNKNTPVNTNQELTGEDPIHEAQQPVTKEDKGQQNFLKITQTKYSSQKESMMPVSESTENQVKTPLKADVLTMTDVVFPLQKTDSVLKGTTSMIEILPIKAMLSRRISMEIGTNYLFGWKDGDKRDGAGFNPLISLQYYHELSKKIALSLGVQYSSINHLNNTSHTSTTTRLKFGEEVDATVVSALNMHYLYAPLKINYRFNRNNSLALGYTLAYLLDVESRVETYTTRLDYASTPNVSTSRGYSSGFNPYDGQISVAYRRRFYSQWYVNAELYFGLFDIKDNVVYKLNNFERTSGFKLSLGINLWKNN